MVRTRTVITPPTMESRVHKKYPMQLFSAVLEVPDFMNAVHIEDNKSFCILGSTEIKARTDFREELARPHPRIHVEAIIFWGFDKGTINFSLRIPEVQYNSPFVRFFIETYVTEGGTVEGAKWGSGYFFRDDTHLDSIIGDPFIMWKWVVNLQTLNLTHPNGKPMGNLRNFLNNGNLTVRVNLLAMSTGQIIHRLIMDQLPCGNQRLYTELAPNKYRGPLAMLYMEFAGKTITLVPGDCKAYFLCHRDILMINSRVLREKLTGVDHNGQQITRVELGNVSAVGLRFVLYYIYHKTIHPGWTQVPLDVLGCALYLEMPHVVRAFVQDLKLNYRVNHPIMTVIWQLVRRHCAMVYNAVGNRCVSIHTKILHPGVPCGPNCAK